MPGRRRRWRGGRAHGGMAVLEPVLLLLLHYGPAHGYGLIERLGEFGLADMDPSVAYRALRSMDERGWIASGWDEDETQGPPRRVYRLTALGNQVLSAYMQDLQQTHRQIGDLVDAYRRHMEDGKGELH
jgi:PadR family transcriptional regulator, regulatory protein PadR